MNTTEASGCKDPDARLGSQEGGSRNRGCSIDALGSDDGKISDRRLSCALTGYLLQLVLTETNCWNATNNADCCRNNSGINQLLLELLGGCDVSWVWKTVGNNRGL